MFISQFAKISPSLKLNVNSDRSQCLNTQFISSQFDVPLWSKYLLRYNPYVIERLEYIEKRLDSSTQTIVICIYFSMI